MKVSTAFTSAAEFINKIDEQNGPTERVYDRAAKLSTITLEKEITSYDIAIIVANLSMASMSANRASSANYIQAMAALAFASQLSTQPSADMLKDLEDGIKDIAAKFAPMPRVEGIDNNATT